MSKLRFNKNLLPLIPLGLLAAAIWYLGPLLMIAHHFPLRDPQKKIALILALVLAWLVKYIFLDAPSFNSSDNHSLTQMLHTLRGRFLGALRFLKKTIIDKHGFSTPLNKLPWYLLIGPPGSGKTTLLAYSNINFILAKQYKKEGQENSISASSVCDWWVTRDLVLIDVPSCYTFSPTKDCVTDTIKQGEENTETAPPTKPHTQLVLWKSLLSLLTKYRQKNNIGAIIIALHLPELIKQSRQQQTQWLQDMKERLSECWNKFGNLPVYFIITKCDLLPGFSEFFNDIGSDELSQPWGIPLSARKEHENLLDIFTERFNALIKRLNKQLIWRLHQERNPQSRPLVKDFPLQLEFLKETLSHMIKTLMASNPSLDLEGIYLTSTTQENTSASATTLFHHDVPSALQTLPPSPFVSRAYFVKHIISYLLPHTSHHLTQRYRQRKTWLPQVAYTLAFTLLFLGALAIGRDFQHGLQQVSTIQRYLSQYQLYLQQNNPQSASIASINNALPLLDTLQTAALIPPSPSHLEKIQTFYSQKSQETAIAIYHKALETIVLPQIRNEFEKYLQTADDRNPGELYNALKAYLLLRQQDPKNTAPQQADFIIHSLEVVSPTLNKKTLNKDLVLHIQNALQLKQADNLDKKLIRQARKILSSLSDNDLAYIILTEANSNHPESEVNLGTNIGTPPALLSKGNTTLIPYFFTAEAFPTVVKNQIPLAAEATIMGNEVLGKRSLPADSLVPASSMISSLTEQLEKTYLRHYIDAWETLVDNISLNPPQNITETDAMILNLISSHSPLLQLLQTIHANTNIETVLSNSSRLQALNTLFDQTQNKQKDSLYQIFVGLHELHLSLQHMTPNNSLKDKQAPEAASILQIRTMAEKYPEPIKNWLLALVISSQNYLQKEAAQEQKPAPSAKSNVKKTAEVPTPKPAPLAERKEPEITPPPLTMLAKRSTNSPYKKLLAERAALALTNKKEPVANTTETPTVSQSGSSNGEYVHVLANENHPLIFVQKD